MDDHRSVGGKLASLRRYFDSGITRSYAFRKEQMLKLRRAVNRYEEELHQALYADLKKSPEESWVTETGFLLSELKYIEKHLHRWMRPGRVPTNLMNFPSSSRILHEPLGVVLIAAPWNYPLQLLLTPLAGAIAAGNCVVLKPSEFAPATARAMGILIRETFPEDYIFYAEGDGAEIIPEMMNRFRFDHVLYTGSTVVGRRIYRMAADQLVPVTLELGGKSPCVVESDANLKIAARRIALAKFSNAGQMCVAPDYVLIYAPLKEQFLQILKQTLLQFFSEDPSEDYNYGKIINEKQFDRLLGYLRDGTVVQGGKYDRDKLYLEPTILRNVSPEAPVMQEEIFGPILPVIAFTRTEEAKALIRQHPDPLAFYLFTASKEKEKDWLDSISFGGGCVNNASWQLTNYHLPFGGRGDSGIGAYHGRNSFETFSHRKSVLKTPVWFDPAVKYPPWKGRLKLFKWILR